VPDSPRHRAEPGLEVDLVRVPRHVIHARCRFALKGVKRQPESVEADMVEERSERIPYFQAISAMADSDAILLIGSVRSDYTASKLFNCILSGKPVLALFHTESLVSRIIPDFPTARLAAFKESPAEEGYAPVVEREVHWLLKGLGAQEFSPQALDPYSAEHLTQQQCDVFDRLFQS